MALLVPVVLCRVKMMTIELCDFLRRKSDEEDFVGPITMLALHRPGVEFTSVLELGLAFVSFSGLLRAPAAVALAVRVSALDKLLLDARLVLAVVICVWKIR